MAIRYTQGRNAKDNQPRDRSATDFTAFEKSVRKSCVRIGVKPTDTKDILDKKKSNLPYLWCTFRPGMPRRRCDSSAGDLYVLPLDLDGISEEGWQCVKAAISNYRSFSYTTASHKHPAVNGESRIRIVLEPSRPITAAEKPIVLQQLQTQIMSVVGLTYAGPVRWDDSVYRPAQIIYLPDENAEFESFNGQPVDVDALLAETPKGEENSRECDRLPAPDTNPVDDLERLVMLDNVNDETFDDIRSALWHLDVIADAEGGCGRYSAWIAMGNRLAWFKGTEYEERARELWIEWSAAAPGGDGDAAAAKWDNDALKADRTGYQAIFKRAGDAGWINPGVERMKHPVAVAEDFEDLGAVEPTNKKPWPAFVRKDKTGVIKNTIDNVTKAVARPDFCGVQVRFDQFRDEIMLAEEGDSQWVPITDPDFSRLRITLERRQFDPVSKELIRDAVLLVADENPFDSAIEWLNSANWDGLSRVKTFFETYFGVEPSEYTSAVSLYAWTALAGRVLSPGCKADMVPVLVGEQGCGKSTGIAALSPAPDFFTEISLAERDEDLSRKMRGRLVGEISELRGLNSKEIESIKAFITRTHEVWVPKYREFATQFPRRLVMFGTTNQEEFLADETGNRRWLPLRVGKVRVDDIKRDVMQLWAEGAELYRTLGGVQFRDAERLASGVHEQHMIKDAWFEIVESWLDEPDALTGERPRTREFLRASDVLQDAIGLSPRSIGKREENRISGVLKKLGYINNRPRVNGKKVRVFERVGRPGPT
ncbi:VapE domain-containing protein [Sodalis endosymbiont of Spalangia cameroni]|uniref:VapE domain-containing protein n=1 Tax=Sodalis praecaptivus TaxID=1239307 RepID=UPI0031FA1637